METPPEVPLKKYEAFRLIFLLAGSIAIGMVISVALHEIGHVIVLLYLGHPINGFYLNPFWSSWVSSSPVFIDYVSAAGFFFSTFTTLSILAIVMLRKKKKAWAVWLAGNIAITAMFVNGVYMLTDSLWGNYGDAAKLIDRGDFPKWILLIIAIIYISLGFLLAGGLFRYAGLHRVPLISAIYLLEIALFLFTIPDEIYDLTLRNNPLNFPNTFTTIMIPALAIHLIPLIARHRNLRWKPIDNNIFWQISWKQAIIIFHIGVLLIAATIMTFGPPY